MTTVAQMIEWMKTLPQDAIVMCNKEVQQGFDTYVTYSDVDIESCDVFDYTSEEDRIKYPTRAGKVYVNIDAA
jgi:hypothetical protein